MPDQVLGRSPDPEQGELPGIEQQPLPVGRALDHALDLDRPGAAFRERGDGAAQLVDDGAQPGLGRRIDVGAPLRELEGAEVHARRRAAIGLCRRRRSRLGLSVVEAPREALDLPGALACPMPANGGQHKAQRQRRSEQHIAVRRLKSVRPPPLHQRGRRVD